jgi:hypothetical protein
VVSVYQEGDGMDTTLPRCGGKGSIYYGDSGVGFCIKAAFGRGRYGNRIWEGGRLVYQLA